MFFTTCRNLIFSDSAVGLRSPLLLLICVTIIQKSSPQLFNVEPRTKIYHELEFYIKCKTFTPLFYFLRGFLDVVWDTPRVLDFINGRPREGCFSKDWGRNLTLLYPVFRVLCNTKS